MPWGPNEATRFTKEADTPHLKKIWASAANSALAEYDDEGKAIRVANAAVRNAKKKKAGETGLEEKSNKLVRDMQALSDRF